MLKRIPPILLCAYFLFFLIPLILASITRPFGWWDWLVVPAMLGNEPSDPALLGWCYWTHLVRNTYNARPTTFMFYYFSYLGFHGEFWAWYVAKWAGFGLAVWWVNRLLVRFDIDRWTRLLIATLLLFHPAAFVLMLFSQDGWAAFWIIGLLLLMIRLAPAGRNPLDLASYPASAYAWFLLMVWLAAGVKEIVVVFLLVLALIAHWFSGISKRALVRTLPIDAIVVFYFWRMWQITKASDRAASNVLLPNLRFHLDAIAIPSPYWLMAALMAIGVGYAAYLMVSRKEDSRLRTVLLLSLWSAVAMLVFTSMVKAPAARYVIPVVFILAIPLAVAASRLPAAWDIPKIALVILIPLFTASDHFSQTLAYQQLFDEKAGMINLIERRVAEGYQIATPIDPADLPAEYQATIGNFFNRYRSEFYHLPVFSKVIHVPEESARQRYVVVANYGADVSRWASPGFHFDMADCIDRGHYGTVEKMNRWFLAFDRAIGNQHRPHFDTGAPELSDRPALQLAHFEPDRTEDSQVKRPEPFLEMVNFTTAQSKSVPLEGKGAYKYSFPKTEKAVVRIPLHQTAGAWRIRLTGKVMVHHGTVSFGVGTAQGKDLWNTPIRQTAAPIDLPQPPVLHYSPDQKYYLFVFVTDGASFELADLSLVEQQVSRLPISRERRYGAFGY